MSQHFTQVSWSKGATIYEVNIRQYTVEGTFRAFAPHLPRLKKMGVDILWFMPITPISKEKRQGSLGSYYACSSYVDTNPEFGTVEDFTTLVHAIHALGMKVIIDWVANHTGWDHEWTKENPAFYLKDASGNFTEKNGWEDVIGLDYTNRDLYDAMIRSMQFWIETCAIDGFRCDMAHLVPLDFWQQARQSCDQLKPLYWLAECEDENYFQVFDTEYGWQWMHLSESVAKEKNGLQDLRQLMQAYALHNGRYMLFTSNHDENSWNGTDQEKYGTALKAFAVLAATWPGMFLLYSGQEIPLQHRLKFFEKDSIDWPASLLMEHFYTTLLHLRKQTKCVHPGTKIIFPETTAPEQVFAYLLVHKKEEVLIILNLSSSGPIPFQIKDEKRSGIFKSFFSGEEKDFGASFYLNAWGYDVFVKEP